MLLFTLTESGGKFVSLVLCYYAGEIFDEYQHVTCFELLTYSQSPFSVSSGRYAFAAR